MKRLRYIKVVIYIIFLSKLHHTAAKAIKTKLLQIQENNNMSLVEVSDPQRKRKKKLIIVDAILFLIQKFEKSFIGSKSNVKNVNNPSEDGDTDCLMDDEDADKAFLLSVLPDLKNLNDDEKLEFRLHTLQFFKSIRNGNKQLQQQILQQPYFGIQPQNHPMLSQYFLNYHSQQSLFPGNRDNNSFSPPYVAPQVIFPPSALGTNLSRRPEPIFCDSLSNSKNLDDWLDLK